MHEAQFPEERVVGVMGAESRGGKGCWMDPNGTGPHCRRFLFPFIKKKLSLRGVKQLV